MSIDLLILGRKKNAREKNKSWSPKFSPSFTCLLQTRWTCWLSRNSRWKRPNLSSLSNCFPSFWSPPWCNHQCPTTYGLNIPLLDSGPLGSRQKKRTHGEWLETWSVTIVRGLAPLNTHNYGTPISWASGILDRLRPNKRMRQGSSWVDTHTHTNGFIAAKSIRLSQVGKLFVRILAPIACRRTSSAESPAKWSNEKNNFLNFDYHQR